MAKKVNSKNSNKKIDFTKMSDEELKEFRLQFDVDTMGFDGKEGAENASNK